MPVGLPDTLADPPLIEREKSLAVNVPLAALVLYTGSLKTTETLSLSAAMAMA